MSIAFVGANAVLATHQACPDGSRPDHDASGNSLPCPSLAREVAEGIPGFNLGEIFVYAIGLGALLALGVITYGGVLWSMSVGSPSKVDEAKEWITGAVYGLLLLIAAYLILNTINPSLLRF